MQYRRALLKALFEDVDRMLLRLYYLCEHLPKKYRLLSMIADAMKASASPDFWYQVVEPGPSKLVAPVSLHTRCLLWKG